MSSNQREPSILTPVVPPQDWSVHDWKAQATTKTEGSVEVSKGIYLAPQKTKRRSWQLHNLFSLDVYGNEGLTRRALVDMRFAAILLLFVYIFESFAWFTLINSIIHKGNLELSQLSILAAVVASIFASVVWLYERQFLTADFSGPRNTLLLAVAVRLSIIIGSAVVTAQPVEVLIFDGPITERLHQENIIQEAVSRYEQLNEARRKLDEKEQKSTRQVSIVYSDRKDAIQSRRIENQKQLSSLAVDITSSESRIKVIGLSLPRLDRQIKAKEREVNALDAQPLEEGEQNVELEKLKTDLKRLKSRRWRLKRERNTLSAQMEKLKKDRALAAELVDNTDKELDSVYSDLAGVEEKQRKELEDLALRYKRWIGQLQNSDSRAGIINEDLDDSLQTKYSWTPFKFNPKPKGFFARLRIIKDLCSDTLPEWPKLSKKKIQLIADEYGLEDPTAADVIKGSGAFFARSYWAVFFISMIIPFLALAFKLAMSTDLKNYYSSEYQASIGNPEAILTRAYGEAKRKKMEELV